MFKRIYLGFCFILFFGVMYAAFITFKPITKVSLKDVSEVTGVVELITEGSGGDIHLKLKNDTHNYYINKASYLGFKKTELQNLLLNKEIQLCHIKRWTPFTRDKVFPHISKLTYRDSIIFDEIIKKHGEK